MAEILHRIGTKSKLSDVYRAVSTLEGLRGWWTSETNGESSVGKSLEFCFRNEDGSVKGLMVMEVRELETDEKVVWRCKEGPEDWVGTELIFNLKQEADFTILVFGHRNWKEASESMAHCSLKWATFLLSLKSLVETGVGRPAPQDLKIDNWN